MLYLVSNARQEQLLTVISRLESELQLELSERKSNFDGEY
jgi:hypothetical protein